MGSALYRNNYPGYDLDREIRPYTRGNLLVTPYNEAAQCTPLQQLPCHSSIGRERGTAADASGRQKLNISFTKM